MDYRTITSGRQGVTYFRSYGRELALNPSISLKKSCGGYLGTTLSPVYSAVYSTVDSTIDSTVDTVQYTVPGTVDSFHGRGSADSKKFLSS